MPHLIVIRSPFDIPAGQWFVVHDDYEIELISNALAQQLRPTASAANGDLTPTLKAQLLWLAEHSRPVSAGRHNSSGQLSKLKSFGYAINDSGRWSITPAGREALSNG